MNYAVTGAYGYSGKYIARRLLAAGDQVITFTNSVDHKNSFAGQIKAHPFNFDKPDLLAKSLEGTDVLINTYWVRFNHRNFTFADAIWNTEILFRAAARAGVKRVVHISITNPSENSPLEYFRGKAIIEQRLKEAKLSYAILRPAVIFGKEDILINNIAWALRRLPVFGIFGDGSYKLQPIYVDDLAVLAYEQSRQIENTIIDAIGPETFTYRDLVRTIAEAIGKRRPIVSVPPALAYGMSKLIGWFVHDVFVTKDEIAGLMGNLLCVNSPPAGRTHLSDWVHANAQALGQKYTSELARRTDKNKYTSI